MLSLTGDKMSNREFRYQESGDEWHVSIYNYGHDTEHMGGRQGQQPAWLQIVLDIATVGGHMPPMRDGPPDRLLWAKIDADNKLLEITFP